MGLSIILVCNILMEDNQYIQQIAVIWINKSIYSLNGIFWIKKFLTQLGTNQIKRKTSFYKYLIYNLNKVYYWYWRTNICA